MSVFIESFAPPPRMVIFGAVDFTRALASVAKVLGYRVVVCDARAVFATRQRFPMADEVVNEWPNRYLEKIGDELGPRDAVCVLTHDSKFDVPAIVGSLATRVGYLGAMGSRKTHAKRTERLREAGVTDDELARIHAPIGLDIGARTPEETAVSICAEIIGARTGRVRRTALRDGERADPPMRSDDELRDRGPPRRGRGGVERARPRHRHGAGRGRRAPSRSAAGRGSGSTPPRPRSAARGAARRRRVHRGGRSRVRAAPRATRSAASTSSCATAADRRPATSRRTPLEAYRAAIELNCLAHIAMCSEAVPAMREQRWGRVLAITSVGVRQPIAGLILSNVARSGLTAFLKTLAREVAGDGVTVNSLQPGLHDTDRIRQLYGGELDATQARASPPGVLGRPEDFGRIAAFLCSESASFLTGAAIPVDGGAYTGLL